MGTRLTIIFLVGWLASCMTTPEQEAPEDAAVLDALLLDVTVGDPQQIILALPPSVVAGLDDVIDPRWSQLRRLRELRAHLFDVNRLHIQYAPGDTKTAAETFESRQGNCLSLSNLFVAAARYLDVDSGFKTVEIRPTWGQEGDTMIRYEHIVAQGVLGNWSEYIVDFLPDFTLDERPSARITDGQALALYHNNLGAEAVIKGDNERAVGQLLKAIKLWPNNADSWNNVGTAYKRMGESRLAELSYKRAFRLNRYKYSALVNLTQFYIEEGRRDEAEQFLDRVNRYYSRNPYFHFYLAQVHYNAEEYERAIGYLDAAVKLERDEPDFYLALAEFHRKLDDEEAALKFDVLADKAGEKRRTYHRRERRIWIPFVITR